MKQLLHHHFLSFKYIKCTLIIFIITAMTVLSTPTLKACTNIQFYDNNRSNGVHTFYTYINGSASKKLRITWDFGDGTTGSGSYVNHTYTNPGSYNTCVYLWDSLNNCGDTFCDQVCYIATPKITFTRTGKTITTTIPCASKIKYYWNFGDYSGPNRGCNFTHTYADYEKYRIRIAYAEDSLTGCIDTMTTDTILDLTKCGIVTNFVITGKVQNTAYLYSKITSQQKGKEIWQWGDGNSTVSNYIPASSYINHTYANSGTYTICHILIDSLTGCKDTICKPVTIDSCDVKPDFTYTISGRKITVTNNSSNASAYTWNFGNQYTYYGYSTTYTFSSDGTYQICLTASNNQCGKKICKTITIEACKLSPDFVYTIDKSTGKVLFYNSSLKGMTSSWSFGDNSYDFNGVNRIEHTYNKNYNYNACMTVINCEQNCSQSICKPIVFNTPNACNGKTSNFSAAYSKSKNQLSLYNQSNFGTNFLWTVYKQSGTAYKIQYKKDSAHFTVTDSTLTICLIAYDSLTGCRDSLCRYISTDSLPQLSVRYLNDDDVFNVYPNPAANKITIAYKGAEEDIIVKITDVNGKLIRTVNVSNGTPLELSTSGLTRGVYIIQPQNQSPPFKLILQ